MRSGRRRPHPVRHSGPFEDDGGSPWSTRQVADAGRLGATSVGGGGAGTRVCVSRAPAYPRSPLNLSAESHLPVRNGRCRPEPCAARIALAEPPFEPLKGTARARTRRWRWHRERVRSRCSTSGRGFTARRASEVWSRGSVGAMPGLSRRAVTASTICRRLLSQPPRTNLSDRDGPVYAPGRTRSPREPVRRSRVPTRWHWDRAERHISAWDPLARWGCHGGQEDEHGRRRHPAATSPLIGS